MKTFYFFKTSSSIFSYLKALELQCTQFELKNPPNFGFGIF